MAQVNRLFIGIQGAVLAIDRATGASLWRTDLKGSEFVTVAPSRLGFSATDCVAQHSMLR